jgi:hypothetical protein
MFKRARHPFGWLEREKSIRAKSYPLSSVSPESFSLQVWWHSECSLSIAQAKGRQSGPPPASRSMVALTRPLIAAYGRSRAELKYQTWFWDCAQMNRRTRSSQLGYFSGIGVGIQPGA